MQQQKSINLGNWPQCAQSKVNVYSYLVKTADGTTYRCNRRHLKQTNMSPLSASMADQTKNRRSRTPDPLMVPELFEENQPIPVVLALNPGTPTHSGIQPTQAPDVSRYPTCSSSREVKKPKYLNDFIRTCLTFAKIIFN